MSGRTVYLELCGVDASGSDEENVHMYINNSYIHHQRDQLTQIHDSSPRLLRAYPYISDNVFDIVPRILMNPRELSPTYIKLVRFNDDTVFGYFPFFRSETLYTLRSMHM